MSRHSPTARPLIAISVFLGLALTGCAEEGTTFAAPHEVQASMHGSMGPDLQPSELARILNDLRRHSAPWHNPDKAAEAGYTVEVGCSDERTEGLSAEEARGMGYHAVNLDFFDPTGAVHLLQPQTLVYALHAASGRFKLAGFDYFVPSAIRGPAGPAPVIAELDMPLMWNDAHDGWIAHIWLWMHNPDGMFENFNPDVPLCECEINPGQALCT